MAPPKKRSAVWSHFTEMENKKAKCVYCAQILALPSGNVCNLNRHLKNKHPTVPLTIERQSEQPIAADTVDPRLHNDIELNVPDDCSTSPPRIRVAPVVPPHINTMKDFVQSTKPVPTRRAEMLDEQLITMIAREYHPLKLVEDVEFRKFITMLCPGYSLPTRKTLSESLLPKLYTKTLDSAKVKIDGAAAVCLATDGWTSSNNDSFIAVMAHFLQSSDRGLKIESVLLGCIEYNDRHTSSNLCVFLQNIIRQWKLDQKVTAIASDNAANITAALREGEWPQIPCFAHSINLCVQASISHISTTVSKVKSIVEFFKRSSHAQTKLLDMQKQLGLSPLKLKQDVPTRWNSTFEMISRLLRVKDAVIATIALLRNDLALDNNDWSIIECAMPILQTFSDITREISSEKNVTLSKVIPLCKLMSLKTRGQLREPIPSEAIKQLLQKLDRELEKRFSYVESNVLCTEATILDPRFKRRAFKSEQNFEKALNSLKRKVGRATWEPESEPVPVPNLPSTSSSDLPSTSSSNLPPTSSSSIWEDFDREVAQLTPANTTAAGIIEVDKYMTEPILLRTKDPFVWWHERRHVYPLLYKYVFKRLHLVATSVPCERVFSKAGYTLNDRRTRLKSNKVSQLLFISSNKQ